MVDLAGACHKSQLEHVILKRHYLGLFHSKDVADEVSSDEVAAEKHCFPVLGGDGVLQGAIQTLGPRIDNLQTPAQRVFGGEHLLISYLK